MYDVITIGSAVRDSYLFFEPGDAMVIDNPKKDPTRKKLIAFEYRAKVSVARAVHSMGGGALNAARSFARAGLSTAAGIALGADDAGAAVRRVCEQEGIDTRFLQETPDTQTGMSVLLIAGGERDHVAVVDRGANRELDLSKAKALLSDTAWIYLTALSGPGWQKNLDAIAGAARERSLQWAWNPGMEQIELGMGGLGRYLKQCAVLLLNRDEAIELSARDAGESAGDSIHSLLDSLLHWGARAVVITDGKNGAYFSNGAAQYHIAADDTVQVVESTGAGDAFGSGFVAGLLRTNMENIPSALDLGVRNAESVIQQVGAQAGILSTEEFINKNRGLRHAVGGF